MDPLHWQLAFLSCGTEHTSDSVTVQVVMLIAISLLSGQRESTIAKVLSINFLIKTCFHIYVVEIDVTHLIVSLYHS